MRCPFGLHAVTEQAPFLKGPRNLLARLPVIKHTGVAYSVYDHSPSRYVETSQPPKVSRLPHLQAAISKFEIVDPLRFRLHFSEGDATYISDNLRLWAIPKKYFLSVGEDRFSPSPLGEGRERVKPLPEPRPHSPGSR